MNNPNIIYILSDDMGYGDIRHLNADCKFPTPNLDRLGQEGMYFTGAHSSSAVCTPSRYSILTGRYCWRTYLKRSVLSGVSKALIEPDRITVAHLLKNAGYKTACIGKWHLGWDWAVRSGYEKRPDFSSRNGNTIDWIDYEKPIANGPTCFGFDSYYGICGSLDMPPYVYVENDMPVETPTAWGTDHEFVAEGPRMKSLRANNVLAHLTDKTVDYIKEQKGNTTPFFLYFPLTAPHTPIAPASEFAGKSGINPYVDFCLEVDHRVGQVLDTLDEQGIAENTLVIFTSDNGVAAGPAECVALERKYNHYSSYIYRGYKSDVWDGGHRMPFLIRWPEKIKANTSNNQTVGIFDFFSTAAAITGQTIPDDAGEDCLSLLPAFEGKQIDTTQRTCLIHHSISGMFAIRKGKWKLLRCPGSGGWNFRDHLAREQGLPEIQLYNTESDPGETKNLYKQHQEVVKDLTETLHRDVIEGRTIRGKKGSKVDEQDLEPWPGISWLPEIPEEFISND